MTGQNSTDGYYPESAEPTEFTQVSDPMPGLDGVIMYTGIPFAFNAVTEATETTTTRTERTYYANTNLTATASEPSFRERYLTPDKVSGIGALIVLMVLVIGEAIGLDKVFGKYAMNPMVTAIIVLAPIAFSVKHSLRNVHEHSESTTLTLSPKLTLNLLLNTLIAMAPVAVLTIVGSMLTKTIH